MELNNKTASQIHENDLFQQRIPKDFDSKRAEKIEKYIQGQFGWKED